MVKLHVKESVALAKLAETVNKCTVCVVEAHYYPYKQGNRLKFGLAT
jgi:hypothetical protein